MKKIFLLLMTSLAVIFSKAQNVGIGMAEPYNKLQVNGNLLVTAPTTKTNSAPTAAQTKTMLNAGNIYFPTSDSTGRLYDPGGPTGNYNANVNCTALIDGTDAGVEITIESMNINTGDSLIISETLGGHIFLAAGNGNNVTGKWVFQSSYIVIVFKSNSDVNTGAGFSLLFKKMYDNSATVPAVSGFSGKAFFFDVKSGSLRSGTIGSNVMKQNSVAMGSFTKATGSSSVALGSFTTASGTASFSSGNNTTASGSYASAFGLETSAEGVASTAMGYQTFATGENSTTMGFYTIASGENSFATGDGSAAYGDVSLAMGYSIVASGHYSTAIGYNTTASGNSSTAMGRLTNASGERSTAMGVETTASGISSTAMGTETTASGLYSTAMGAVTTASGNYSTSMGNFVSTNNQNGSFVIGDNSTSTIMNSPAANNFRARFANGYRLYTSSDYTTSCSLGAGANAWATGSDVRTKENFADVDGEDFLKKIRGLHLTSWNYKTQDPASFRHYGPMAQDFFAAFGKDKYGNIGNDTTINSADFAGVSFIAIQALEKRTQAIVQLEKENAELKKLLLQIRKEVDELKKK